LVVLVIGCAGRVVPNSPADVAAREAATPQQVVDEPPTASPTLVPPTEAPPTATATASPAATVTASPAAITTATAEPSPTATALPTETVAPSTARVAVPARVPPDQVDGYVEDLLAGMSLEARVGQLFMVYFHGSDLSPELRRMIREYHIGGIVLFASVGNIQSPQQVAELVYAAQQETLRHSGIPLLVSIDQEGGSVMRLRQGATVLPGNMAVGAIDSPESAYAMAQVLATELAALGINMNLAPVLDVNSNPANPVIGLRSLGASPERVATLGRAMVEAHQDAGVLATAKHFPGHGDTSVDSHFNMPMVDHSWERLEAVDLPPFRAAIEAGVAAIMTAHIEMPAIEPEPGLPATLSSRVLQGLLREGMGYDGLIVTDSMTMGAIMRHYGSGEAAVRAVQAGADVLAYGADWGYTLEEAVTAYRHVLAAVNEGAIPTERLDESVRRILRAKLTYGLFDVQPPDATRIGAQVGTAAHRAVARRLAEDSITLLRDDDHRVPLSADERVLVVWPRNGGNLGAAVAAHHAHSVSMNYDLNPTGDQIAAIVAAAGNADVVVIGTRGAGMRPQQVALVRAVAAVRPVVVVALGTPYDLLAMPEIPAYMAAYGEVPASLDAVGRVLVGLLSPRGRLPVDLPGLYDIGAGLAE
jgi:beta-N-acetylhexosaminidase